MSIGKGKVSFAVLHTPAGLPDEWVAGMMKELLPPISTVDEAVEGWAGFNHVKDQKIGKRGGYPTGKLVKAERKIPGSTLDSEVYEESKAVMEAEGKGFLNHQQRSEIKKSVKERLLPEMPVSFKAIEWVYIERLKLIIIDATSEKQIDAFCWAWQRTFGGYPILQTPENLATALGHDCLDWPAVAFADQGELFCQLAGSEFLMWLWWRNETGKAYDYMIEGPLDLSSEHKSVKVRAEMATVAPETVTALVSGMTVVRCSFSLVNGEEVWAVTPIADSFGFQGMKLPQTENFDINMKFAERVVFLVQFWERWTALYGEYCAVRSSKDWKKTVVNINSWIYSKANKRRVLTERKCENCGGLDTDQCEGCTDYSNHSAGRAS